MIINNLQRLDMKRTLIIFISLVAATITVTKAQDYVPTTGGTFEGAVTINGNLTAGNGDWGL